MIDLSLNNIISKIIERKKIFIGVNLLFLLYSFYLYNSFEAKYSYQNSFVLNSNNISFLDSHLLLNSIEKIFNSNFFWYNLIEDSDFKENFLYEKNDIQTLKNLNILFIRKDIITIKSTAKQFKKVKDINLFLTNYLEKFIIINLINEISYSKLESINHDKSFFKSNLKEELLKNSFFLESNLNTNKNLKLFQQENTSKQINRYKKVISEYELQESKLSYKNHIKIFSKLSWLSSKTEKSLIIFLKYSLFGSIISTLIVLFFKNEKEKNSQNN